ncbi:MAG: signal recognition particle-docking protein FtsY [Humidesulfovibrio sp.]|uniref:signal recognition particle-docking protein FtsY n=1 Tax=Humidesulfovibrio sp. TaxID=2910988 RepID=UPI0027E5D2DA|nr:signal recognition particle-docking protein FtsY [Humidesulfovibrio sp.]MDQ7835429.1 signal recognition particle-docking protein FtsY [Humidesulfovibrio sp.]
MGFFSKVKKLWGGNVATETPVEATPQAALETGSQAGQAVEVEPSPASEPAAEPDLITQPEAKPQTAELTQAWRDALSASLTSGRAKISEWLGILLSDISATGPDLWARLRFLFATLGAPKAEAEAFIAEFNAWATAMNLQKPEDIRSELRYRLVLALDLEQEQEERTSLFKKLTKGLAKTKARFASGLGALFGRSGGLDDGFWDELEEIFITADMGSEATQKLLGNLKTRARTMGVTEASRFREVLSAELEEIFPLLKKPKVASAPEVVMMVGVNGVGKTTTIAKLAYRARLQGRKVLIAAGDTFRAAAIGQLEIWAGRVGAGIFSKAEGADPAAVAFEAVDKAQREGFDLVLLDTAGRLHTKVNLMEELRKIKRVLEKKHPGAPHRVVLVIDATTGQNALSQTKLFHEAVGVDEIVLTKLDGTAKGGVMVSVAITHKLPISFIGLGEKMEDLRPFVGEDFAKALLGDGD